MKTSSLLAICLLSLSTLAFAQAPDSDAAKAERRAKVKEARDKAAKACDGRQGQERRDCMRREMCAQAKDPKACEARAEKARAAVQKARQACEGKQGDERRACMRQELNRK
jgi:hypothetical protein